MKTCCTIEGCDREHVARGWCEVHYQRWRRRGDPLAVGSPSRRGRGRSWTEDEMVEALQRYAALLGEAPAFNRLRLDRKHLGWLPGANTFLDHFGSWNAALEAAGLVPRRSSTDRSEDRCLK